MTEIPPYRQLFASTIGSTLVLYLLVCGVVRFFEMDLSTLVQLFIALGIALISMGVGVFVEWYYQQK